MTMHRTVDGETWDYLSLKYYGTEKLMHLIISANPDLAYMHVLRGGLEIVIPDPPETVEEELPPWKK